MQQEHFFAVGASADSDTPTLTVFEAREGAALVVSLAGELDFASRDVAARALDAASARGGRVVVDLSELTFLDAGGLGMFVAARRNASEYGGRLSVRRPTSTALRLFDLTGLGSLVDPEQTELSSTG